MHPESNNWVALSDGNDLGMAASISFPEVKLAKITRFEQSIVTRVFYQDSKNKV